MKSISIPISKKTFSHNLLTNLTGIVGNLRLLSEENLPLPPQLKSCFEDAACSGEELLKFANCLIEQSQTVDMNIANCPCEQQESNWLSVLLVEDTPIVQRANSEILKSINCHVDIASNGYEALDMLNKTHDAVLLDIKMPGMDGYETATRMRQQLKIDIPIIGITASLIDEVQELCLLAGFNEVIKKPVVNTNELKNLLQKLTKK